MRVNSHIIEEAENQGVEGGVQGFEGVKILGRRKNGSRNRISTSHKDKRIGDNVCSVGQGFEWAR